MYYIGCSTSWPDIADFSWSLFLPAIFIYKTNETPSDFTYTKPTMCKILVRETCAVKGHDVSYFDIDGHSVEVFYHNYK